MTNEAVGLQARERACVGAGLSLVSGAGGAQTLDGAYRGMIVCEKVAVARDILSWHGTNGEGSRSCHIALVPAPTARQAQAQ